MWHRETTAVHPKLLSRYRPEHLVTNNWKKQQQARRLQHVCVCFKVVFRSLMHVCVCVSAFLSLHYELGHSCQGHHTPRGSPLCSRLYRVDATRFDQRPFLNAGRTSSLEAGGCERVCFCMSQHRDVTCPLPMSTWIPSKWWRRGYMLQQQQFWGITITLELSELSLSTEDNSTTGRTGKKKNKVSPPPAMRDVQGKS